MIPLPTAADNHQQKNAESLVQHQAGAMLLQKDLTPERLINEIQRLRQNKELRRQMSTNVRKLFIAKAAVNIAEDLDQGLRS